MKNQRKQSVIITKLHKNVSSSVKCMWWYTTCRVFMTVTWDNICLFSYRLKFGISSSLEVVANLVFIFILWSWQLWKKLPYESRSTRKLAPVSISNSSNSLLDHQGQGKRYSNLLFHGLLCGDQSFHFWTCSKQFPQEVLWSFIYIYTVTTFRYFYNRKIDYFWGWVYQWVGVTLWIQVIFLSPKL